MSLPVFAPFGHEETFLAQKPKFKRNAHSPRTAPPATLRNAAVDALVLVLPPNAIGCTACFMSVYDSLQIRVAFGIAIWWHCVATQQGFQVIAAQCNRK